MPKISALYNLAKKPRKVIRVLGDKGLLNWIPDKQYLKLVYWGETGRILNIEEPQTYSEKIQWLKLHDRKPEYSIYVDKYAVRSFIAETIGEKYLIPLIGVYDSVEEIDWVSLPDEFVLKCTHGSGSNIICPDKNSLDIEETKKRLQKWMNKNWYWFGREWPYKNVKPRIICEELIKTENGGFPYDYKFYCFNGEPDNVMVCIERESGNPKFYFFDNEWNLLRYNLAGINAPQGFTLPKPKKMDEMFMLAKKLSSGFPFIRVDFFCENEKIYFGELTFFPASGFDVNLLKETDILFGEKLELDK